MKKILLCLFLVFIALMGVASVSACDVDNCTVDDCQQVNHICENNLLDLDYNVGEKSTVDDNQQNDLENNNSSAIYPEVPDTYNIPTISTENSTYDNVTEDGGINIDSNGLENTMGFLNILSSEQNDILGETYYFTYIDWLHSHYGSFGEYDWLFLDNHYGEYVEEALEYGYEPEGEEINGLYILVINGMTISYDKGCY